LPNQIRALNRPALRSDGVAFHFGRSSCALACACCARRCGRLTPSGATASNADIHVTPELIPAAQLSEIAARGPGGHWWTKALLFSRGWLLHLLNILRDASRTVFEHNPCWLLSAKFYSPRRPSPLKIKTLMNSPSPIVFRPTKLDTWKLVHEICLQVPNFFAHGSSQYSRPP
jgi:hypothetical protein